MPCLSFYLSPSSTDSSPSSPARECAAVFLYTFLFFFYSVCLLMFTNCTSTHKLSRGREKRSSDQGTQVHRRSRVSLLHGLELLAIYAIKTITQAMLFITNKVPFRFTVPQTLSSHQNLDGVVMFNPKFKTCSVTRPNDQRTQATDRGQTARAPLTTRRHEAVMFIATVFQGLRCCEKKILARACLN